MESQVRLDKLWFLCVFARCCTRAQKFCALCRQVNAGLTRVVPEGSSINISRIKRVALIEGGKMQVCLHLENKPRALIAMNFSFSFKAVF